MRICRPGLPPIDDDPNAPKPPKARPQPKLLLPGSTPPARPNTRPAPVVTRPGTSSGTSDPLAEAQRAAAAMAKGIAAIPPRAPKAKP
jgi:hypothetical protein